MANQSRVSEHEKLSAWIGKWRAEGTNYAANGTKSDWRSEESADWLAGKFFVEQRWREHGGKEPFIGLGVFGFDAESKGYFIHQFENHGFYRRYDIAIDGNVWTFSGATERARVEFTDNGDSQFIRWEFKPNDPWLPLCDRIARRVR